MTPGQRRAARALLLEFPHVIIARRLSGDGYELDGGTTADQTRAASVLTAAGWTMNGTRIVSAVSK